jgi:DNA replication ATP-dependent helicase Dna2
LPSGGGGGGAQPPLLPLPGGAGRGDLKRQALLIHLAAPRFWSTPDLPWAPPPLGGGDVPLSARVPTTFARCPAGSAAAVVLRAEYANVLNSEQRSATERLLSARDYACLLGMPGTGKTSTLAFLIRCLAATGRSVLITSHTHSAVDNLLLKCIEAGLDVLRVGRKSAVHPGVAPRCLEALVGSGGVADLSALTARLATAQVVGVTCLGIRHALFTRRTFDVCIVDEASQLLEPVALGPLRAARVFFLVGDHMQLPPLVVSPAARAGGLDVSLFKRLCEAHPAAMVSLTRQYRMNGDIQCLSNLLMYKGALQCGSDAVAGGRYEPPRLAAVAAVLPRGHWLLHALQGAATVRFLDTDATPAARAAAGHEGAPAAWEARLASAAAAGGGGGLLENRLEAAVVAVLVMTVLRCGGRGEDVGVIAPFRSQLRLLRRVVDSCAAAAAAAPGAADADALSGEAGVVEIDTVDRFQGRDKEVILVSMVRSNAEGDVGNVLGDVRRLNVGVSRAKKKLLLVGSASCLEKGSPHLAQLLAFLREKEWLLPLPWGPAALEGTVGATGADAWAISHSSSEGEGAGP